MRTLTTDTSTALFRTEHARILRALDRTHEGASPGVPGSLVNAYDPSVCLHAQTAWRGRMVNEHRSSSVFAALLPQLIEASATLDVQTVALRMATDEIHHAILCGNVVKAFGGEAVAVAEATLPAMPAHLGLAPLERVARNAMFIGCLAETVAVGLVSQERAMATEPLVRTTLDQILADEVTHARFGWQYLAHCLEQLGGDARMRMAAYLRVAFAYFERREVELLPLTPPMVGELREQHEAVALCNGSAARELFYETVQTVIVPRFEQLGIAARTAWRDRAEA